MKASFANMKLKTNNKVKTFDFNGQTIEVLQYLPAQDKYDLIMIALQKAAEDGIYNEFKLSVYFEMNLVYLYTNIYFTEKQREDEFKLYDLLKGNGFFDVFYKHLNSSEYDELLDSLKNIKASILKERNNIASIVANIIEDLPQHAEAAAKIVDTFDPNKYQAVRDFAIAANGGRDILTNLPVNKQ